jgi:RHS repeat-associated protein
MESFRASSSGTSEPSGGDTPAVASGTKSIVHRYYDSGTGQFVSVDPLSSQTGTPYAYGGGDPVNERDPVGLCDVPSGDPNQPFIHTHNGSCTAAEQFLNDVQANLVSDGASLYEVEGSAGGSIGWQFNPIQGLEGGVNALRGLGNAGLKLYALLRIQFLYTGSIHVLRLVRSSRGRIAHL